MSTGDRSEWMAEVCRHAALTMEAHGLGNRTEQLRNVADQLAAAPPPPAEQASGEPLHVFVTELRGLAFTADIKDKHVGKRIRCLADNLAAALSQRPVVDEDIIASTLSGARGSEVVWDEDRRTARLIVAALAPQQPTAECQHEWAEGYGVPAYCKHCGMKQPTGEEE